MIRSLLTLLPALALCSGTQAAYWSLDRLLATKRVQDVSVSADGNKAAYMTLGYRPGSGKPFAVAEVLVKDLVTGADTAVPLPGDTAALPNWSPDGRWFSVISDGALWMVNSGTLGFNGGTLGLNGAALGFKKERFKKLTEDIRVTHYKWSPDSRYIAFVGIEAESNTKKQVISFQEYYRKPNKQLFLLELAKNHYKKISGSAFSVDHQVAYGFDWAWDSSRLVYTRTSGNDIGDWVTSQLVVYDLQGQEKHLLMQGGAAEFNPLFAPDGNHIAFVRSAQQPKSTRNLRAHLIDLDTGEVRSLAKTANDSPLLVGWLNDGKKLIFVELANTLARYGYLDRQGKQEVVELDYVISGFNLLHRGQVAAFNAAQGMLSLPLEQPGQASEAFIIQIADKALQQVSRVNPPPPTEARPLSRLVHWQSADGRRLQGILSPPLGENAKQPYPLIVYLHGGPPSVSQQRFIGRPNVYPLAHWLELGYGIFEPNFRGSHGYGAAFREALIGGLGETDVSDVLDGVKALLGKGEIDSNRIAVVGWSYGGYLTSAVISAGKQFKAASIGAAPSNLASYWATSDFADLFRDYLKGTPAQIPERYQRHSPVFRVNKVATPVLIQHGELDRRVPLGQAIELYRGLLEAGADVDFDIYPGAGHSLKEYNQLRHAMQRNTQWLVKYLSE